MSKTNQDNFEERFEAGEEVLEHFETGTVLTIHRLAELSAILNLSALAREAGINVQTLQAKIRRKTPELAEGEAVQVPFFHARCAFGTPSMAAP